MTASESRALESLRGELSSYHAEVREHIARCEACHEDLWRVTIDVYGSPENREGCPGLMKHVADLRGSRRRILLGLKGAWALLIAAIGACAALFKW